MQVNGSFNSATIINKDNQPLLRARTDHDFRGHPSRIPVSCLHNLEEMLWLYQAFFHWHLPMFPNLEHIARVDQRIVPPSSSPPFWITSGQTWICIYIYSTIYNMPQITPFWFGPLSTPNFNLQHLLMWSHFRHSPRTFQTFPVPWIKFRRSTWDCPPATTIHKP